MPWILKPCWLGAINLSMPTHIDVREASVAFLTPRAKGNLRTDSAECQDATSYGAPNNVDDGVRQARSMRPCPQTRRGEDEAWHVTTWQCRNEACIPKVP